MEEEKRKSGTEPNALYVAKGAQTITLAGKEWPLPPMTGHQNRIIIPLIAKIGRLDAREITTAQIDDVYTVIHTALTRAHPEMTREEFLSMEVSFAEVVTAMPVITKLTLAAPEDTSGAAGPKAA